METPSVPEQAIPPQEVPQGDTPQETEADDDNQQQEIEVMLQKEVPSTTRAQETEILGMNIIHRKKDGVQQVLKDHPASTSEGERLRQNKGIKALEGLKFLEDVPPAASYNDGQGIQLAGENPLVFSRGSDQWRLTKILSSTEDNFICEAVSTDGKTRNTSFSLSRSELSTAFLIAEKGNVLSTLEGAEQRVVDKYMKSIEGSASESDYSEETDADIREVARNAGILTVQDVEEIVSHLPQDENTQQLISELQGQLHGENIVTFDVAHSILNTLGVNEATTSQALQQRKQALADAQIKLDQDPTNEDNKKTVEALLAEISLLSKAAKALQEDSALLSYLRGAQEGRIPTEATRSVIVALRSGDVASALEVLAADLELDKPENEELKEELVKKFNESGSIGKGWLFALMWRFATSETKALKKSLQ